MNRTERPRFPDELDVFRIVVIGRIARCRKCPRYRAMLDACPPRSMTGDRLPRVPQGCTHQVCAPIAERYRERIEAGRNRRPRPVGLPVAVGFHAG